MEDGCTADIRSSVTDSVAIILASQKVKGYNFFLNLRKQKDVVIPEGVWMFGGQWFKNSKIESITIPTSVKEILSKAFYNCKNLKEVVFKKGSKMKTIGKDAFYQCTNLAKINLPNGLEQIGVYCFAFSGLEEINFPTSVREVGAGAFCKCR